MASKVFGIGLSKTGTTSLTAALRILGHEVEHGPEHLLSLKNGRASLDFTGLAALDGITDVEAAGFYIDLDQHFPDAKFILTTRPVESWLVSCQDHFHDDFGPPAMSALLNEIYGDVTFDESRFRVAYRSHDQAVREHFKDRPDDLLVLDTTWEDKWTPLCAFLGLPRPKTDYPRKNVSSRLDHRFKNALRSIPGLRQARRNIQRLRGHR